DPHQGLQEPAEHDLPGHGLRSLDDGADIELLDRGTDAGGRTWRRRVLAQMRMLRLAQAQLAFRSAAEIGVARIPEIGLGGAREPEGLAQLRRALLGQGFVLDEALLSRQPYGLLVEPQRLHHPALEARNLGADQGGPAG